MNDYLLPLKEKIKALLPTNTYFTLDDSDQSFVVYPTNHVCIYDEFVSIQVATVIYENIKEHTTILDRISELYSLLVAFSDTVEDYASINPLEGGTIRLNWGGVHIENESKDFDNVQALIDYLKIYK